MKPPPIEEEQNKGEIENLVNPVKLDQDQFNENYKQQVIEYEELLDWLQKKK